MKQTGRGPSLAKGKKKMAPAGTGGALPIMSHDFLELEDGTKIPVKIPPGMSKEQAEGVINFLKSNPDAAKAAWQQAQTMLKSPGLAQAMINMQQQQSSGSEAQDVFEALKDDEDLAHVLEDVKSNGPAALQKYWDDTELMSRISQKLRALRLAKAGAEADASGEPRKHGHGPPAPPKEITSLHEAAKWGDVAAATRLLEGGADVNGVNERGISSLGVAVGFNRHEMVKFLLESGADVMQQDGQGNTPLHYAAGYGRQEIVKQLVLAGAELDAVNKAKQSPMDAAKLNGEKQMVALLKEMGAGAAAAVAHEP